MRTAVVEIGSAACRVVVAEATSGGWLRVALDRSIALGLGRAVRRDGALGGVLLLAEETVRRLGDAAFRAGAERTIALVDRELAAAADGAELCRRVEVTLGTSLRLTDPHTDTSAAARAVSHRLALPSVAVLVQLTEDRLRVATGTGGDATVHDLPAGTRDLLPLGAVDPLHPAALASIRSQLAESMVTLPRPQVGTPAVAPVLIGKPAIALGRAVAGQRWGSEQPALDGTHLSTAALADLERELLDADATHRMLLRGVDPGAIDQVTICVLTIKALLDHLGSGGVVIATVGAVEGHLLAALYPDDRDGEHVASVVRERAIAAVATPHAQHVADLAEQLADQLTVPLSLTDLDVDRLVTAARLHEFTGRDASVASTEVPFARHGSDDWHGARRLLVDGLPGVGPQELAELACLVGFQSGRIPGSHPDPYGRLSARRRRTIDRLVALLRLACALDAGHDGVVAGVDVQVDPAVVRIQTIPLRGCMSGTDRIASVIRGAEALLGARILVEVGSPCRDQPRGAATVGGGARP